MLASPKTLEVMAIQEASLQRYQENLDSLLDTLKANPKKELILAPEVFLTGLDYEHMTTSAKFSASALKTLKKAVDTQILVLTVILQEGEEFVNQAVVIHKHKIVHRQEKCKLFRLGDEDLYFQAGKKKNIKPFEINGVNYAILICFELRFKDLWKQIEGADVVLVPALWGALRKKHLEILSKALAVMNQCYVLVANSANKNMAKSSALISPMGECVQDDKKSLIEAKVDFREIKKIRRYIVIE